MKMLYWNDIVVIYFKYHSGSESNSQMTANIAFKKSRHITITLFRVDGTEKFAFEKSIEIVQPFLDRLNVSYQTEI